MRRGCVAERIVGAVPLSSDGLRFSLGIMDVVRITLVCIIHTTYTLYTCVYSMHSMHTSSSHA